jgi:hypothetical protein
MSGLRMIYFVLKPGSKRVGDVYAHASRDAMEAYAKRVEYSNPELAEDLIEWIGKEDELEELKFGTVRKPVEGEG